jgi:hypothetical protein
MTDWNSFLRSDEFTEYRKRQIKAVAHNIKTVASQITTKGALDLPKLQGKLEMINLFLKLPETLTKDTKTQEILRLQLDEDINTITQMLIRDSLHG